MASKEMYALGSQASVIRDLFAYGQEQAAVVGKDNVFDFSIGNPTVPAPSCVREAIEDILRERESAAIHGYTAAAGDGPVRQGLADFMNKTYGADVRADNFYMTCGAAASLVISLKAIVEDPSDEVILVAPFFPEYTVFVQNAGAKSVILPPDTEHFQISLDAMEQAITPKTRAIIVNSPNNPSGVVYSAERMKSWPPSSNENRRKSAIPFTSFPMNRTVKSFTMAFPFSMYRSFTATRSFAIPTASPSAFRANALATSSFPTASPLLKRYIRQSAVPAASWALSAHPICSRTSS